VRAQLAGAFRALAAGAMSFAVDFIQWLRVDDPIGAVAVRLLRH
jgi:hypothetical protein